MRLIMILSIILPSLLFSGRTNPLPQKNPDISAAAELAAGLSTADMKDAFPSRDMADIANWYGTSLFGWK
jgi:hypothetical protein